MDNRSSFFRVACAVIEHIPVRRVPPEEPGPRKSSIKQHVVLKCERQGDHGRGCPDIANEAKNPVFFVKSLYDRGQYAQAHSHRPPRQAATSGRARHLHRLQVKGSFDANHHLLPELFGGPDNGAERPNRISLAVTPRATAAWPEETAGCGAPGADGSFGAAGVEMFSRSAS